MFYCFILEVFWKLLIGLVLFFRMFLKKIFVLVLYNYVLVGFLGMLMLVGLIQDIWMQNLVMQGWLIGKGVLKFYGLSLIKFLGQFLILVVLFFIVWMRCYWGLEVRLLLKFLVLIQNNFVFLGNWWKQLWWRFLGWWIYNQNFKFWCVRYKFSLIVQWLGVMG